MQYFVTKKWFYILLLNLISFNLYSSVTINMEKINGVYKIPCIVNGLKMKMIFDTGASDICLSQSIAEYMLENDYITTDDILGNGKSTIADGRIVDHVRIRLKDVELGGLHLYNVEAVVMSNQTSPLLLGLSAIQELGKISLSENNLIIEETKFSISDEEIDRIGKLAEQHYHNGRYTAAIHYYKQLFDANKLTDYGKIIYAECYRLSNQPQTCITILKGIGTPNDNQYDFYYNLSCAYFLLKDKHNSKKYFELLSEYTKTDEQIAMYWELSGLLKSTDKHYKEAFDDYYIALAYRLEKRLNIKFHVGSDFPYNLKYYNLTEKELHDLFMMIVMLEYNTGEPSCLMKFVSNIGSLEATDWVREQEFYKYCNENYQLSF